MVRLLRLITSRMAIRIYAIGLIQFLIVIVVLEIDHRREESARRQQIAEQQQGLQGQQRPAPPWEAHGKFVAEDLTRVIDDPPSLQGEVTRIANAFAWSIDVRGPDGAILAHADPPDFLSGGGPPGPGPSLTPIVMRDGRIAHLEYTPRRRAGAPPWGGPLGGPGPAGRPPPDALGPDGPLGSHGGPPGSHGPRPPGLHGPPGGPPLGLATIVILIVVGVSSWLMARSFARPLERLTIATRAFGRGELDARARMARGDEIGEVAKAFDDMADRITALLLAERELLANVSHELRTPLARIRVALDLANEAAETTDPRAAMESFAEIAQDLEELERIVDDVLASARLALDAGSKSAGTTQSLPVRAEPLDMAALLEKSIARFRTAHPHRELLTSIPNEPPLPSITGDPVLLRRVVDNLLDNAQKYTDDKSAAIKLDVGIEKDAIVIDVIDNGIGIAKQDQSRLFEPFFRVDRSRTRSTGGLGLGLVLARRVVEAHEGTLTIESELGKGTKARVRLPTR